MRRDRSAQLSIYPVILPALSGVCKEKAMNWWNDSSQPRCNPSAGEKWAQVVAQRDFGPGPFDFSSAGYEKLRLSRKKRNFCHPASPRAAPITSSSPGPVVGITRRLSSLLVASQINVLRFPARSPTDGARSSSRQRGAWRDFLLAQTILLAGPRIAEPCALEVADIDLANGVLAI